MVARIERRQRADGGITYRVKWVLGGGRNATGSAQSESFTSEARALSFKADVEAAGHRWPKGWEKGRGYVAARPEEQTLTDVAEAYFAHQERRVKRGVVKAYTLHRYRRSYALHIEPVLASVPFDEISPRHVESWVDDRIDDGVSPKSIRNRHGLLYSIMAFGQKHLTLRPDNPCEITELPEVNAADARQIRFFQHDEWALFRSCLKADVRPMVDVLLATGLRWGEASALRVGDIRFAEDGKRATIHVVRAWSKRAPNDPDPIRGDEYENKSWKLGPPKNRRSRYVVVDGQAATDLRSAVTGKSDADYVFATRSGTPWRYPDFHYDRWLPARKEAAERGLVKHPTPHMLRHTAVVWSLAEGVKIEKISEQLGHGRA
jgi:integrase